MLFGRLGEVEEVGAGGGVLMLNWQSSKKKALGIPTEGGSTPKIITVVS